MSEKANMAARYEHEIPEGYEARIEGNKVIIELKESEDERIRRGLLRFLGNIADKLFALHGISKNDALAYLEKQKEQKPAEEVLIRAGLKPFKDGNQWCILVGDNIQEGVCGFGDTIEDALYEFLKDFCEQRKPAEWSEEDEDNIRSICSYLDSYIRTHEKDGYGVEECKYRKSWLKSLRPQPKAELTLLDENIIKAAVAFVEQNDHFNCWGGIDKHTVIKALRFLKPHWKPSEEQMEALKKIIEYCRPIHNNSISGWDAFSGLCSLYNDLKKL